MSGTPLPARRRDTWTGSSSTVHRIPRLRLPTMQRRRRFDGGIAAAAPSLSSRGSLGVALPITRSFLGPCRTSVASFAERRCPSPAAIQNPPSPPASWRWLGRTQHSNPPWILAVALGGFRLVCFQKALKHEPQHAGGHGHRVIVTVPDQFAVADVVHPRLDTLGGSDGGPSCEGSLGCVGQRRPWTVQAVGQLRLVEPAAVLFHNRQELAGAFEFVCVAGFEDARSGGGLA